MGKPRKYKNPTPDRLANIALYYLGRYAASESSLRRVLENRIRRACLRDEVFADDRDLHKKLHKAIDDIVEGHKKSGVINDEAFAEMKVRSLRRSGGSRRKISIKLQQKGIKAALVEQALVAAEEEDPSNREEVAALAYAKRRRLGEFRSPLALNKMDDVQKAKRREKDFAAMARAGFSFDVIKDILEK